MDVATGQLTEVLTLPEWQRYLGEPRMRPLGEDRVPRIVLGELGQYRIDVKNKRLMEDNTVRGEYRYVRGREPEKLFYRDTLLAEGKSIPGVGVSPDGRRAVWLTARYSPSEWRYHDAAEGKIRTRRQRLVSCRAWQLGAPGQPGERDPVGHAGGPCRRPLWEKCRKAGNRWSAPRILSAPNPPELDRRPDVNDVLAMTLSTDKPAYAHHEQVQLTVT